MRFVSAITAQRLGSVAQRYRRVTLAPAVAVRRRHNWRERMGQGGDASARQRDSQESRRQRVEAILFLSREPLNSRKLAQHARLADGTEARTLVRQLNRVYDETGRAFRVEEVAGGFRLLTRRQFAPWLRRLSHVPPQERLSAPAMETLAVVAYRQPVLRAEIEAVRGVSRGEILRQLMERDLVRIGGRSEELGRPYLYTTTKRFLQLFGLQSLEDLPRAVVLRGTHGSTDQSNGLSFAPMFTDDQLQEQEKSEVSVTLPTQTPVDELLEEVTSRKSVAPQCDYDEDEFEDDEDFDEFEDEDEDVEDEEEFEDEEEEFEDDEDEEEDFDEDEEYDEEDDDFEDEEWEEVEDDEEDLEEGWEDEDEDWDDEYEEDDDEEDEESDDDFEEEEEEEEWD